MKNLFRKSLVVILGACILATLVGCGAKADPVKDDLYQYLSQMTAVQSVQVDAITKYNEAVASADSRVLYDELKNTILPAYDDYLTKLDAVTAETEEVKAAKQSLVDASNKQKEALNKIADAIDAVDKQQLADADLLVTEAQTMFDEYYATLNELATAHGITMTNANGNGASNAADSTAE